MADTETNDIFAPIADDAGVEWAIDAMFGKRVLCVSDVPGGQLGFSVVGLDESFADLLGRLPFSPNRAEIIDRVRKAAPPLTGTPNE